MVTVWIICWVLVLGATPHTLSSHQRHLPSLPFNDPTLSWESRVDDLVQRLTLEEMTDQMAHGGRTTYAPAIERLGIKPYSWGTECLRGDVAAGPATSFPQALGLAATFSPEAIFNMSRATGLEVRAKYNNYTSHGQYGRHKGVSCWSPVINIVRDPRWGRIQETYGEDPYMSGVLAASYVRGLQGSHPRYVLANAGCKHYDAYGGPENIPVSRHSFDAQVAELDLRMTFLPQFQACVAAGSYSIMCSYNGVNGIPACAHKRLLTDILRNEWGFAGYVVSDEGAIEDILVSHKYASSIEDTVAAAVNAGTNLEDGPQGLPPFFAHITKAVQQGKLTLDTVRNAVKPLFYTRMRLGEFDPPAMNPYSKLDPSKLIQSAEHRELSTQLAMKSFVLLKNSFLPLKPGQRVPHLAIVGPMANDTNAIFGGYSPDVNLHYTQTPFQGLQPIGQTTTFAAGCNDGTKCENYDNGAIKAAVTGAQLVIVCLGTGANIEGEDNDRANINLPGKQLQLLQDASTYAVAAPVILLLFNAGPLDISWATSSARVVTILECFFPAQATGEALHRVFYAEGPGSNPAGRLPVTWPAALAQIPAITNYTMDGRTYRYFQGEPLYPFGFGLSYSRFQYSSLEVRPRIVTYGNDAIVTFYVHNLGPYDGEEVVQVYVSWHNSSTAAPHLQLVAFHRYAIAMGRGQSCQFRVSREQLSLWHDKQGFVTLPGVMSVYVGGQQPNQVTNVGSNILTGSFTLA